MTTGTLPRTLSRPFATAPARRSVLTGFAVTLAAGLALLAAISAALAVTTGASVLSRVSIGGVSLEGLDRVAAEARLTAELPSVSAGSALVTVDGTEFEVPYADLGRRYEWDAMLDAAFAVGRDGGIIGDAVARLRAPLHDTEVPIVVHAYDADALADASRRIALATTRHPIAAAVAKEGTTLTVLPANDGQLLETATVEAALGAAVEGTDPADVRVALQPTPTQPPVSTAMATDAAAAATEMMAELPLTIPGATEDEETPVLSEARIASWLRFGLTSRGTYEASIDADALGATIRGLAARIDRDPVNADFSVAAGGGLGGVIAGLDGRELQVSQAIIDVRRALATRATGESVPSVTLPVLVTAPALTTETAADALPQMRLVSSWTTRYVPNDGNGFGNNISIGAWDLDGYTIAPGDWFSFWGGIGPVTLDRGYRYGGAIINGRSVANGALAGGICSTSTTLFNAAMRFGLEIGERENHFYYIDRYPTGLDATVAIVNSDVTDMTFRNDTDAPIVIRGFGSPGQVTFQLWSIPNGRSVVLGAPITSNHRTATDTTQLVSSMAPGTARRVEFPHNGFDVSVSRWVYGADGELIHQNTWFSDYRPVNGITLVGPAAPAPPPDEDEPPDEDA
jgi:vancomycin resistance protein YoaR